MLIFMESGSHYSPTFGVKLGKCNQAEMYGEHMEFDSLRFHYFACHMSSMEIDSLFDWHFCRLADSLNIDFAIASINI